MTRSEVYSRLAEIFQDVFEREVPLTDATTAADVPGWDSLNHVTLIGVIEDEFEVKMPMKDIIRLKNVGDIVTRVIELVNAKA